MLQLAQFIDLSRSLRRLAYLGCAVFLMPMAACQQTVLLGTECDRVDLPCIFDGDERPSPPRKDTDAEAEAGPDEPLRDSGASQPEDDFAIANPNFERGAGIDLDGDFVISDIAAMILPKLQIPSPANVPGWYACLPLSVTSNSTAIEGATRMAGDYVTFVPSAFALFDFAGIRQDLAEPLAAGMTVHFEVDVIADSAGMNPLYLEVSGGDVNCKAGDVVLGRSKTILDSADWQRICVTFSADQAYPVLMLRAATEGSQGQSGQSLKLDSLRLVTSCP